MPEGSTIKRKNTDRLIDSDYELILAEVRLLNDHLVLAKMGNKQSGGKLRTQIRKINALLNTIKSESNHYSPE